MREQSHLERLCEQLCECVCVRLCAVVCERATRVSSWGIHL